MESLKMSDVFELPVSRDGFKLKDKCGVSGEMHVAKFADLSTCVYAELAINNHDRLVEENKQQRESLDAFKDLVKAQTKMLNDLNEENNLQCETKSGAIEAIEAAMRVKELWLPMHIVANEHEGEAIALHSMYKNFEAVLSKIK